MMNAVRSAGMKFPEPSVWSANVCAKGACCTCPRWERFLHNPITTSTVNANTRQALPTLMNLVTLPPFRS